MTNPTKTRDRIAVILEDELNEMGIRDRIIASAASAAIGAGALTSVGVLANTHFDTETRAAVSRAADAETTMAAKKMKAAEVLIARTSNAAMLKQNTAVLVQYWYSEARTPELDTKWLRVFETAILANPEQQIDASLANSQIYRTAKGQYYELLRNENTSAEDASRLVAENNWPSRFKD